MADNTSNQTDTGSTGAANTPAPVAKKPVQLERGSSNADIKRAYDEGQSYYQIAQAVYESTSDESVSKVRAILEPKKKK